jgi:hypothetical protein
LLGAGALLLLSLGLLFWLSIDFTGTLDFEPANITNQSLRLIHLPAPHDGPVVIFVDVQADRGLGPAVLEVLREVRLVHLRNGAFAWRIYEDLAKANAYRVEMMYPSWTQYLLQQERMTKQEKAILDKARALHIGEEPAEVRHFLCVNRELHTRRFPVTRPTGMVEAPLGVDNAT